MRFPEYDNFMFDLYGTLIDIRTDEHADSTWSKWIEWLDKHNIRHPQLEEMREDFFNRDKAAREEALKNWGFEVPEIDIIKVYRKMFSDYGNSGKYLEDAFLDEASYAFRVASREYMRLFPGVSEFLKGIRESGRHAYILSNAQKSYTLPEILYFELDKLTDGFLISSDYRCMKPDRVFYDAMINTYNLDRAKTVMIGDSHENDYEGGLKAGLHAIWLGPDNPASKFYT